MSSIIETNSEFSNLQTSSSTNSAQEQQVHDLIEFIKLEHKKNVQYRVLLNILKEYSEDNSSDNRSLKEKIKDIILRHNISQLLALGTETHFSNGMSVFGIKNVKTVSVSYLEGCTLQNLIKVKLEEKKNLNKHLKNSDNEHLPIENGYSPVAQLSRDEKSLINMKKKLILEQKHYVNNLMELEKILVEISQLRLKTLPDGVEQKIRHSQAQEKINNLKAQFTEGKMRYDILTETNCSLKAYKELIKDIKGIQSFYQKEIETLEDLKEQYKQVSCKQFDDIVLSYRQYKTSLGQKKKLLDYLTT